MNELYYGVSRNYRGLLERRYLYTASQLASIFDERSPESKGKFNKCIKDGSIISFEGAFWANDTYVAELLKGESAVLAFVKGNNAMADYEDPTALDLAEWYSSFETECMFTGNENLTAREFLRKSKLKCEDLTVIDPRAKQLLDLGLLQGDFYRDDIRSKRFSEIVKALSEK